MGKIKQSFINILAIVSIIGFGVVLLEAFNVVDIRDYATAGIFVVIGFGLMIEGNIRTLPKMLKNGITSNEMTHILAMFIGLSSILVGVYSLPELALDWPIFVGIRGLVSAFAILIIIVETWMVK